MKRLVFLALFLAGCATENTYTDPQKCLDYLSQQGWVESMFWEKDKKCEGTVTERREVGPHGRLH